MDTRNRASICAGACVTEELEYDGGRQVTVYVPPDSPEAVVFAGDGQLISRWGAAIEQATVPPADDRRCSPGNR